MSDKPIPLDPKVMDAIVATDEELRAEIRRLNEALDMVAEEREAWKRAFHRAHEMRGEWLKTCPLCQP